MIRYLYFGDTHSPGPLDCVEGSYHSSTKLLERSRF